MNQDDFDQPQDVAVSSLPLPGQLVRHAREQRSLSLRELSEKTRLTENVLNAVERDDFPAMGEPVYARGYYRKCAEALSLNAEALVEAYEQHSGTASPVPTIDQRPSIAYREGPGKLALAIAVGLMLLVFISCALWLWSEERVIHEKEPSPAAAVPGQAPSDSQTVVTPMPAERPQVTVQPDLMGARSTATVTPIPQVTPAPIAAVAPQGQQALQPVPAVTAAASPPQPAPKAGEALLRLQVSGGEAWIDIRDREGRKLIYKLLQADHVQEVRGQTPLRVSLGRADHVSLMLNGRAIDMSAYIEAGLTANFLMDASGRLYKANAGTAQ